MKKQLLIFLLSIITLSAFGQAGSLSQSVYRSRVNDSTAAIAANVSAIAAGYAPMFFNNQATTPHWDIWNGAAYDHVFDFNSGSGGGWVTTGVQPLTGPFGVESADSIGIASNDAINIRTSGDVATGFSNGDYTLGSIGTYAFNGIYKDGTTGTWAYMQSAAGGSVNTVNLQTFPTGESHFSILVDTMDLQLRKALEINDDPGSSGEVLTSNGAGAAPTWEPATGGGTPGGSTTQVQYNNAGAFAGISGATTNGTILSVTTAAAATNTTQSASTAFVQQEKLLVANRQTASYGLVLSDAFKLVEMNVATANNLTVPLNSTQAFVIGTTITVAQYGAGTTTVVATGGVTIRSSSGLLTSPGQYAPMVLEKIATDEWYLWNGSPANISYGTYTPTLTNSANLAASTAYACTYLRVGNSVTVSGRVDIDPTTTATLTTLGISIPVASTFTTANQAGGSASASSVADASAALFSDSSNARLTLQYICTDVTNHAMYFTATYQVL